MSCKGGIIMDKINMDEILGLYEKLGIQVENTHITQDISISHNWNSTPFGLYTENGFNYSNNTNLKP